MVGRYGIVSRGRSDGQESTVNTFSSVETLLDYGLNPSYLPFNVPIRLRVVG